MLQTNLYAVLLDAVRFQFDRSATERLLDSLERAIRSSAGVISSAPRQDADYADAVTDAECDSIEEFLGIGFVVCQVSLKSIVSAVHRLHRFHARKSEGSLTTTTPQTILRHGLAEVAGRYTAIEVMNASANYYKHRDEWHGGWASFKGQQAATVSVIRAAGAEEGSTGNLRALAKAVGNPEFSNMGAYCDVLLDWTTALHGSYRSELRTLALL